jgi:hypothetical protein
MRISRLFLVAVTVAFCPACGGCGGPDKVIVNEGKPATTVVQPTTTVVQPAPAPPPPPPPPAPAPVINNNK